MSLSSANSKEYDTQQEEKMKQQSDAHARNATSCRCGVFSRDTGTLPLEAAVLSRWMPGACQVHSRWSSQSLCPPLPLHHFSAVLHPLFPALRLSALDCVCKVWYINFLLFRSPPLARLTIPLNYLTGKITVYLLVTTFSCFGGLANSNNSKILNGFLSLD